MAEPTPSTYEIVAAMEKFGGSFARALAECCHRADPTNLARIQATFPEVWQEYTELAIIYRTIYRKREAKRG